ncbi:unnamed protein product [Rhizoctonia solani]|uniref:Uncharacterized protein n=1 Tax=Rhizoctonia solani TaxID=456999 RepID=A0A8H3HG61_9AGAM
MSNHSFANTSNAVNGGAPVQSNAQGSGTIQPTEVNDEVDVFNAINIPEPEVQHDLVDPAPVQDPPQNPSPLNRSLYGIFPVDGN